VLEAGNFVVSSKLFDTFFILEFINLDYHGNKFYKLFISVALSTGPLKKLLLDKLYNEYSITVTLTFFTFCSSPVLFSKAADLDATLGLLVLEFVTPDPCVKAFQCFFGVTPFS